jgi:hypothetical protein
MIMGKRRVFASKGSIPGGDSGGLNGAQQMDWTVKSEQNQAGYNIRPHERVGSQDLRTKTYSGDTSQMGAGSIVALPPTFDQHRAS